MPAPPPLPEWVHDRRRTHGRRIQDWRRFRGFTQEQTAERAGLSLSSVQRIEAGGEIRFSAVLLVAEALGVPIGSLLSRDPGAPDAE
ncbi:MAG: helix-turn-helix transcriptional regulator [Catenulispora sp.]|nr:helix-turn-helix transcriptional regulator [Catenulispora sp.]